MDNPIKLTEKYERNGWPSLKRPDLKPPEGWNLSLLTSLERIRSHALSPDGKTVAYIKDGEFSQTCSCSRWMEAGPPASAPTAPWFLTGMMRLRFGHRMGNGSRSASMVMCILCRAEVACPERSQTSRPRPAVRASCLTHMD